jgi:hypothetical protein
MLCNGRDPHAEPARDLSARRPTMPELNHPTHHDSERALGCRLGVHLRNLIPCVPTFLNRWIYS